MSEPMIRLDNVSKTFASGKREVEAVRNIDLEIEKGDIFGIIGLSGAGKSTLVRCLNLLERPTEGRVYINGREMTGNAKSLKAGDIVSVRGKGKFIFESKGGTTRKDKLYISIKRYI